MDELREIIARKKLLVEQEIKNLLAGDSDTRPAVILEAMTYSLTAGGKRIRPVICLMCAELFSAADVPVIRCAAAIEFLHTYTLIHDDLPCMDNDDLRRGRPTLHRVYPESIALLAGDALLTKSFEIIARNTVHMPEKGLRIIAEFAEMTGLKGVIGGQVMDIMSENKDISPEELALIHQNKTAKLIIASARIGAILGGADENELGHVTEYGCNLGLAFQIADDILDETGDAKIMGKNPGQDKKLNKATYVKFFGLEKSREILSGKIRAAAESLAFFGEKAITLSKLAHFIGTRES